MDSQQTEGLGVSKSQLGHGDQSNRESGSELHFLLYVFVLSECKLVTGFFYDK